jgi:hypothetical protein
MDILTQQTLQELISHANGSHLSILMPTHPAGKEKEQDPIRFKNLLKKAEETLKARGEKPAQIEALLEPARQLTQDPFFWERQSSGLALFSAAGMFRTYRLPLPFEETAAVADHFHLKPLLPYFANDGHFFILALSQNHIRLLEGTRHTVEEIDLELTHPKLAQAMRADAFFDTVQARSAGRGPTAGEHITMFHGHDPSDEEKKRILGWLHTVDDELGVFLKGQSSPLVLAGVDSIVRLYREACAYGQVVAQTIFGSPEEMRAEDLHQKAWPLVEPIFQREQQEALGKYGSLSGTDQAVAQVRPILEAARHGRVDTLFVSAGEKLWGQLDRQSETLHIHREPEPQDRDLLDWAAVETLIHGGAVHVLEASLMPEEALMAATLRY